jgi:hypothetical protein
MFRDHEKFIAFVLLGGALFALAVMIYLHPIPDSSANSGVLQILNMIIGAMIGGFGAAVNALFRSNTDKVTVDNSPANPVPVEPSE